MVLSEQERQLLAQIESSLAQDTRFWNSVKQAPHYYKKFPVLSFKYVSIFFLIGMILLLLGVVSPWKINAFPIVSFLGFLIMFISGLLAVLSGGTKTEIKSSISDKSNFAARKKASIVEKFEVRFRNRFQR